MHSLRKNMPPIPPHQTRRVLINIAWNLGWVIILGSLFLSYRAIIQPLRSQEALLALLNPDLLFLAVLVGGFGGIVGSFYLLAQQILQNTLAQHDELTPLLKPFFGLMAGLMAYFFVFVLGLLLGLLNVGEEPSIRFRLICFSLAGLAGFFGQESFGAIERGVHRLVGQTQSVKK